MIVQTPVHSDHQQDLKMICMQAGPRQCDTLLEAVSTSMNGESQRRVSIESAHPAEQDQP